MARDKITVQLELQAKQAYREVERLERKIQKLGKGMSSSFGGGIGGGDKVRALGTGLSKATVKADEFNKSLEASNARVIAFGASAGLIMVVDRALKAMVSSAIKVEKAMMDVNIVMDLSTRQLEKFGKGMFRVAKETGQAFDTVAEATTEFARQGLGMENTLVRTKDALILTRLTGMKAADSVKSLTAAVNSFNKEGVTSAQVINRMAKVDQMFAVSSDDLAKAVSRVGASAISAGVSLNELMAITTAVQQKTARGGAVIGNAFKTIFTRIQRSDVKNQLRDFGVAVTDNNGKMLSGIQVLQSLATEYKTLSKTQQASIAEQVAGVFQVNILKAALSDLSSETSHYKGALIAANTATDEAYQKNQKLNTTLDTLVNKTMVNLTQAGAGIGGATLAPAINRMLNIVNSTIDSFGDGGRFETFGKGIGSDLLKGIGNALSGPGLILVGAVITKLALSLAKYSAKAFADVMGINAATKQRIALEEAVIAHISAEPALLAKVNSSSLGILSTERSILATIKAQTLERAKMSVVAAPIAGSLYARGARVGPSGATYRGRPGGASGFIPNFADAGSERMAAAAGGYRAGGIRTMQQPGSGTMMYNSAETVKRFPGMSQSAIMPPKGSLAGENYGSGFSAAHGFNPYAASGFIPNYAKGGGKGGVKITPSTLYNKKKIGVLLGEGPGKAEGRTYSQLLFGEKGVKKLAGLTTGNMPRIKRAYSAGIIQNPTISMEDIPSRGVFPLKSKRIRKTGDAPSFDEEFGLLEEGLGGFAEAIQKEIFGGKGSGDVANVLDFMGSSAAGEIFEAAVRAALKQNPEMLKGANKTAPFDFNPFQKPDEDLLRLFDWEALQRIEAKIKGEAAGNIVSKYANEFYGGKKGDKASLDKVVNSIYNKTLGVERQIGVKTPKKVKAQGFVPNFSPLTNAVGRELSAGVPASAIRIGSASSLRSSGNRGGLGVYNTIHEPGGLGQGISRSRSQGMNPKTHGYSGGFIPNFDAYTYSGGAAATGSAAFAEAALEQNRAQTEASIRGTKSQGTLRRSVDGLTKATKNSVKYMKSAGHRPEFGGKAMGAAMLAPMFAPMIANQMFGADTTGAKVVGGIGEGVMYGGMASMGLAAGGTAMAGAAGVGATGALATAGGLAATAALPVGIAIAVGVALYKIFEALEEQTPVLESNEEKTRRLAAAQYDLQAASLAALEGITALGKGMTGVDIIEARDKAVKKLEATDDFGTYKLGDTAEFKKLKTGTTKEGIEQSILDVAARGVTRKLSAGVMTKGNLAYGGSKGLLEKGGIGDLLWRRKQDATNPMGGDDFSADLSQSPALGGPGGIPFDQIRQIEAASARRRAFLRKDVSEWGELTQGGAETGAEGLMKTLGIDKKKYFTNLIKSPDKGAGQMANLQGMTGSSLEDILSGIQGGKAGDYSKIGDDLRSVLSTSEMHTFKQALIETATSQESYAATLEDVKKADQTILTEQQKRIRVLSSLIGRVKKSDDALYNLGRTAQVNYKLAQRQSKQNLALLNISRQSVKSDAATLKTKREMILLAKRQAVAASKSVKKEADSLSASKRTQDSFKALADGSSKVAGELLALFKASKLNEKGGMTRVGAFETAQTAFEELMTNFANAVDVEAAKKILDDAWQKQVDLMGFEADSGATMTRKQGAELAALREATPKMRSMIADQESAQKLASKAQTDTAKIAGKTKDLELQKYLNTLTQNRRAEETVRAMGAILSLIKDMDIEARYKSGTVSNTRYQSSRMGTLNKFAEQGLTQEEIEKEFKEKGSFTRGMDLSPAGIDKQRRSLQEELDREFRSGAGRNLLDEYDSFSAALKEARTHIVGFEEALQAASVRARVEADYKAGRTTSDSMRDVRAGDRLTRRRTGKAKEGDMMEAFTDQFLYNGQDYMDEFEGGVVSVAGTMKSSFADAFQSITSGADNAQNAFANMAQNILNSVSQMSAQMFTNMMFSKMGFSQGGLVPGYAGGGVVRGGSGYKDDVPTMMQGGEFVIKKSSAQKIGYGTLNSINGYAEGGPTTGGGGPSMWKMGAVSAGASALSGIIQQANTPGAPDPLPSRDYGFGKSKYGFLGGADPDAGQADSISGGRGRAGVSLGKGFVYYRRDPETGRLISERARPTEGRFEVSQRLSLLGRLGGDDPQTSRMFGKEQTMANYQSYLETETQSRKDQINAVKKQKKQRLIGAYMNAAMLIGGAKYMQGQQQAADLAKQTGGIGSTNPEMWGYMKGQNLSGLESTSSLSSLGGSSMGSRMGSVSSWSGQGYSPYMSGYPGDALGGYKHYANGGGASGSPAMVMGGEYVMSPETVRTYGSGFMQELNRGNVPAYAGGGPVGGVSLGNQGTSNGETPNSGNTTNNVKISVNVDKSGKADASVSTGPQGGSGDSEESDREEVENNKALGKLLQGVVLEELVKQQRPGGLLRN